MAVIQELFNKTGRQFTVGVIGAGIVLALSSICGNYASCSRPRSEYNTLKETAPLTFLGERERERIVGAVPVSGDTQEPLYIMDRDGDGIADIIMRYPKQALYVVPGYEKNCGLIVDKDTKILDKRLREAATRAMRADQELTALLHK